MYIYIILIIFCNLNFVKKFKNLLGVLDLSQFILNHIDGSNA